MHIFYPTDFDRTVFVRVTNSDQSISNVGVSFCADFCMIILLSLQSVCLFSQNDIHYDETVLIYWKNTESYYLT